MPQHDLRVSIIVMLSSVTFISNLNVLIGQTLKTKYARLTHLITRF